MPDACEAVLAQRSSKEKEEVGRSVPYCELSAGKSSCRLGLRSLTTSDKGSVGQTTQATCRPSSRVLPSSPA